MHTRDRVSTALGRGRAACLAIAALGCIFLLASVIVESRAADEAGQTDTLSGDHHAKEDPGFSREACAPGSSTYIDAFDAGLDPVFWNVSQTTPGLFTINTANGDVRLAKTAMNSPGGLQNIVVQLNLAAVGGPVAGDFSTQIDFSNAVIGPAVDQVEFHTYYADNSIFFNVYDNSMGNTNVHVWNGAIQGYTVVAGNSGTFRIARTGSTLTGSFNGTPIFSQTNSSPLTRLEFILQLQPGSNDMTSVTFDNFSFTGGQCGSGSCPIIAPENKVSWWRAEGNPNDSVGTNHGSLVGGTTYTAGKVGQAFNLNGTNAGVTIPHNSNLNLNPGGFSAEFWMKANASPTSQALVVDKSHGFVDSAGWAFQSNPAANRLSWFVGAGGGGSTNFIGVESTVNPFDGNFHHIAGTWDGTSLRLYVDGVLQGTIPFSAPVNNTRPMNIGYAWGGGSPHRWVNGIVDEVRVYSRPLNAAEIRRSAGRCIGNRADFDGDGRTDLSVFRPSEGNWYVSGSGSAFGVIKWGISTDTPVPGDFDGDGRTDTAVFRPDANPGNPDYYVLHSSTSTFGGVSWGTPNDVPVIGDYDGDGRTDFAVFRPAEGKWYILNSSSGSNTVEGFGLSGDMPVPFDPDNDGNANLAVYRPGNNTWYIARPTGSPATNFDAYPFGASGDRPVPADYDGDGRDDLAVFRPSNGTWYIRRSSDNAVEFIRFGLSGDLPIPGDYDGDGRDDQALFRAGTWYLNRSTSGLMTVPFGLASDIPIPARHIP